MKMYAKTNKNFNFPENQIYYDITYEIIYI